MISVARPDRGHSRRAGKSKAHRNSPNARKKPLCVPKTSSSDEFSFGRFKPLSNNAWSKKARSGQTPSSARSPRTRSCGKADIGNLSNGVFKISRRTCCSPARLALVCASHFNPAARRHLSDCTACTEGNGSLNVILLDGCSLFMEVNMAKRKPRAWTKKDIAELKAHSKSRTPVSKISKVMKRTTGALRRKAGIVGIRLGHRR